MEQPIFLNKKVWFGKAVVCQDCERKYFWSIVRGLKERETTIHLSRGAFIHEVVDKASKYMRETGVDPKLALGQGMIEVSKKDEYKAALEDDKTLLILDDAWTKISKEKVVKNEFIVKSQYMGYEWWTLPDHILQDEEGFWIGELKNTMAWGDRLRTIYYRDLQPWYYRDVIARECPEFAPLVGVKLFVATPPIIPKGQKTPRIIPPEVMKYDPLRERLIQEFYVATCIRLDYLWIKQDNMDLYYKDRTRCVSRTSECPYIPLCDASPTGLQNIIDLMYTVRDPQTHYYEKEES